MGKERILDSESLEKVVGGSRPQLITRDEDQRWEQYKFDKKLEFENKKLEAEIKKAWIEGGFKLASSVVEGLTGVAKAVAGGGK